MRAAHRSSPPVSSTDFPSTTSTICQTIAGGEIAAAAAKAMATPSKKGKAKTPARAPPASARKASPAPERGRATSAKKKKPNAAATPSREARAAARREAAAAAAAAVEEEEEDDAEAEAEDEAEGSVEAAMDLEEEEDEEEEEEEEQGEALSTTTAAGGDKATTAMVQAPTAGGGAAGASKEQWAMHVHRCRFTGWMPDPINTLAVLPKEHGGHLVAVARAGGDLELISVNERWSVMARIPGHVEDEIRAVVWLGMRLFAATVSGVIFEADFRRGLRISECDSLGGAVWALAGSTTTTVGTPGGGVGGDGVLAAGCEDGTVRLFVARNNDGEGLGGGGGLEYIRCLGPVGSRVTAIAWGKVRGGRHTRHQRTQRAPRLVIALSVLCLVTATPPSFIV